MNFNVEESLQVLSEVFIAGDVVLYQGLLEVVDDLFKDFALLALYGDGTAVGEAPTGHLEEQALGDLVHLFNHAGHLLQGLVHLERTVESTHVHQMLAKFHSILNLELLLARPGLEGEKVSQVLLPTGRGIRGLSLKLD